VILIFVVMWGIRATIAGELVKAPVNLVELGVEPPGAGDDQSDPAEVGQANGRAEQDQRAEQ